VSSTFHAHSPEAAALGRHTTARAIEPEPSSTYLVADTPGRHDDMLLATWPFTERRKNPDRRLGRRTEIETVSVLAHEMRTPLSAVTAIIEILSEQVDTLPPETEELLQHLQQGVRWIHGLIENIDTWGQIREDRLVLRKEPISVAEWVTRAVDITRPLIQRRRQRLHLTFPDPSPVICGDALHLGQALVNLITNASRYGGPGSAIDVSVAVEGQRVLIRVCDEGPGLTVDEQDRIFGRYTRGVFGVESVPEGQGLGLHIVRCIVELHDGTVGVDSVTGEGATFWIALPI
jgi:signal transduction histidine kinase